MWDLTVQLENTGWGYEGSLSLLQPEVSFNSTSMEKAQVHLRSPPPLHIISPL